MPPSFGQRLRDLASALTYPLHVDDLLGVLDPLASGRQLRAQVARVEHPTERSATIYLRPGRGWVRHQAGQWIRVGVEIDGVLHWRSYSLTTAAGTMPAITVTDIGRVSGRLVRETKAGDILTIEAPEGEFTLPERPRPLLFLTAGSGITPVMSMLRSLAHTHPEADVVLLHSVRTEDDDPFAAELAALHETAPGLRVHRRVTSREGRFDLSTPAGIEALVPDWRERAGYACGPQEMLDAAEALWAAAGTRYPLVLERFAAPVAADVATGAGGVVEFTVSDVEVESPGDRSILETGEEAGVLMPSGCRMGICRTCLTRLARGQVRDLTTGEVHGEPGDLVRTCVSAPAGDVALDR